MQPRPFEDWIEKGYQRDTVCLFIPIRVNTGLFFSVLNLHCQRAKYSRNEHRWRCSNKEVRKRLARRHSRNGRWTHECCFEVDVFVCWECIEVVECCFEVISLFVEIECGNCNYLYYFYDFLVLFGRFLSLCCLVVCCVVNVAMVGCFFL